MAKEVKKDAADWRKELARDFIALGSIPFYVLVIARLTLPPIEWSYMFQLVFAAVAFALLAAAFKFNIEAHAGLGFILLVLVSLYYNNLFFTIFAIVVYSLLLMSLFYLKKEKSKIWKGILAGAISAAIGYFIANWVV